MVTRSASKKLAEAIIPVESNKKRKLTSFTELGDDSSLFAPVTGTSNDDGESDSDSDDDDAPEEEANVTARKGAKRREVEIKELNSDAAQKRKRAAEAAQKKADAKKAREQAKAERAAAKEEQRLAAVAAEAGAGRSVEGEGEEVDEEDEDLDADAMPIDELDPPDANSDATPAAAPPPKSNKLDPALFAAAFAAKGDGKARGILDSAAPKGILRKTKAPSAKEVYEARKVEKRLAVKEGKRLARGKDGEAIRRLQDGRTIVRALHATPTGADSSGAAAVDYTALPPPPPLDASQSLPPARARAFKKRALGHKSRPSDTLNSGAGASRGAPKSRKSYDPDDPLGLNDPAFAPGGEFAHIKLDRKPQREQERIKGKATRRKEAGLGWKGEGGRIEARKLALPVGGSARPAVGFARSRSG